MRAGAATRRQCGVAVVTPDIPELSRFEIAPAITDRDRGRRRCGCPARRATGRGRRRTHRPDGHQLQRRVLGRRGRPPVAAETAWRTCSRSAGTTICRACCATCAPGSEARPSRQLRLHERIGPQARRSRSCTRRPDDYGVAVISSASPIASCRRRRSSRCARRSGDTCRRRRSNAMAKPQRRAGRSRRCESSPARLPEPSATLLRYVNDRDVVHLGARLLPLRRAPTAATRRCRPRSRRSRRRRSFSSTAPKTTSIPSRRSPNIWRTSSADRRRCAC